MVGIKAREQKGAIVIGWEGAYKRMLDKRFITKQGCWESNGSARVSHSSGKGYPVIRIKVEDKWNQWKMAKVSAFIHRLPQQGPHILHRCNNPECWNPQHIYWGTHLQNMRDKIPAGTSLKGENHKLVKLTQTQVNEIGIRGEKGESHSNIARDYPVKRRQISRIISKDRW